MRFAINALPKMLAAAAALVGMLFLPMTISAESPASRASHNEPVEAQFRGCEAAGWCRFWIEPPDPTVESMHRVRPDGVSRMPGDGAFSIAVRDRLNALLASMIHQHKQILLHGPTRAGRRNVRSHRDGERCEAGLGSDACGTERYGRRYDLVITDWSCWSVSRGKLNCLQATGWR